MLHFQVVLPCRKLWLGKAEFWVIDQEMNEILLDRLLLKCIGFDLAVFLSRLVKTTTEFGVGHVCPSEDPAVIKVLNNYSGIWYNHQYIDPIESADLQIVSMCVDDPEDIEKAIIQVVESAKSSGTSVNGCNQSVSMQEKFRDVLRIS